MVGADRHDLQSERPDLGPVKHGASVENALLATTGLGYATLWIEGWKRSEGAVEAGSRLVGLPDEIQVQVLIAIGLACGVAGMLGPGEEGIKRGRRAPSWREDGSI